ncbi:MAG: guanylate kinase [Lachnospiraceae bacterium]|nr:guanylate kinase [Lachnospiraceae bacterium]
MGGIYYLMGKSSSGKDTIYRKLMEDQALSLKTLVMYTTRPIRDGEHEGKEYHFVTEEKMQELEEAGRVIEKRTYPSMHGPWHYFTVDDGVDLSQDDYLIIGTPESYVKLRDYFGEEKMYPILLETDDGDRLQRALNRERKQDQPKYSEMCRRFLADEKDFSREKIKEAGIDKVFRNDDLRVCLEEIRAYIINHK